MSSSWSSHDCQSLSIASQFLIMTYSVKVRYTFYNSFLIPVTMRLWLTVSILFSFLVMIVNETTRGKRTTVVWMVSRSHSTEYSQDDKAICQIINSRLLNSTSHELLVQGYNGGLGHKFISLFYSITFALLTGRRFRGGTNMLFSL